MKKIFILICLAISILSCEETEIEIRKLEPTDFKVTIYSSQESSIINETIEFNLLIETIKPITEQLTYTLKLFENGIEGELSVNGNVYSEGGILDNIQEGFTTIKYKGHQIGSEAITIEVRASNGVSKNVSIPIVVEKVGFDLKILFDKTENYINETTSFNIEIEKKGLDSLTYKAYFKNVEGEIKLNNQDELILQNRTFEVQEGITFGEFKGTLVQEDDIEFVVEASNGIVRSQTINFKTLLTDFEVVMTPDPMAGFYLWDLNFTYFIQRPKNLEQEIEYYLYITSMDLGDLMYNMSGSEDDIAQGFEWSIGNRISNKGILKQLGVVSPRSGIVTFHFRDSNGATYEKSINVDYHE